MLGISDEKRSYLGVKCTSHSSLHEEFLSRPNERKPIGTKICKLSRKLVKKNLSIPFNRIGEYHLPDTRAKNISMHFMQFWLHPVYGGERWGSFYLLSVQEPSPLFFSWRKSCQNAAF